MWRERPLKVVLVVLGLIFSAGLYPVADSLWHSNQSMYTFDMMLSLYVALGVFLLLAARNPPANRSLIAFTAWSCFAHAAVMAVTAFSKGGYREDRWGVAVLVIIGVALIVLAPAKKLGDDYRQSKHVHTLKGATHA
jgi:peptidoglycan/LPS O-acetylase OafA/YrhL